MNETVGENFEISETSIGILKDFLPRKWLFREQNPDFFLDYVVEVVESGEPTGLNFGIQLKGTQPKKGKPVRLSYALKAKHLRYYVEKSEYPVFLILVDIVSRKAYWCFIQKLALGKLRQDQRKKERGTVSIPFSKDDCLDDFPRFRKAIAESVEYMKEQRPGTIKAAVKAEMARINNLDPRIDVKIDLKDGTQHFTLLAKEEVEFKVGFEGIQNDPQMQQGLTDFIEKGTKLKVAASALKIEGVPLLEHLISKSAEAGFWTLKFETARPGAIQVFENTPRTEFIMQLEGEWDGGTKYSAFEPNNQNSPIRISAAISHEGLARGEEQSLGFHFSPASWNGQKLLQFSQFDAVKKFTEALSSETGVLLKFHVEGNELFSAVFQHPVERLHKMVEMLSRARFIALRYGVNPVLPKLEEIPSGQWHVVADIFDYLTKGKCSTAAPGIRCSLLTQGEPPKLGTVQSFQLNRPTHFADFLGTKIDIGPTFNHLSEMALVDAESGPEFLRLKLEATEKNIWTITRPVIPATASENLKPKFPES